MSVSFESGLRRSSVSWWPIQYCLARISEEKNNVRKPIGLQLTTFYRSTLSKWNDLCLRNGPLVHLFTTYEGRQASGHWPPGWPCRPRFRSHVLWSLPYSTCCCWSMPTPVRKVNCLRKYWNWAELLRWARNETSIASSNECASDLLCSSGSRPSRQNLTKQNWR